LLLNSQQISTSTKKVIVNQLTEYISVGSKFSLKTHPQKDWAGLLEQSHLPQSHPEEHGCADACCKVSLLAPLWEALRELMGFILLAFRCMLPASARTRNKGVEERKGGMAPIPP
jgi:hypothetical protein